MDRSMGGCQYPLFILRKEGDRVGIYRKFTKFLYIQVLVSGK